MPCFTLKHLILHNRDLEPSKVKARVRTALVKEATKRSKVTGEGGRGMLFMRQPYLEKATIAKKTKNKKKHMNATKTYEILFVVSANPN